MSALSVGFTTAVIAAYAAATLLRRLMAPAELAPREDLEGSSVHVFARVDALEGDVLVKVPLVEINRLHRAGARRGCELVGYISAEHVPERACPSPSDEILVSVSVWWNPPELRSELGRRLRQASHTVQTR